jgi:excisionase family DNA binding protein
VGRQELLRPRDLATPLGVSRDRVYQLIRAGELPAVRIGNAIRIPRASWEAWLAERDHQARRAVVGGRIDG